MPLRRLAVSLSLFALLLAPDAAFAAPKGEDGGNAKLPPACAAAGARTMAECQALLKRAGPKEKAPPAARPGPERPPAPKPEPEAAEPKPQPPAKPRLEKPAEPKPEVAKPEIAKPEAARPEPAKPAAPKPETPKPAAPEPKPETAKPEAPKPEAAKPEQPRPEAAKPQPAPAAEAPDCTRPGAAKDPACRAERQRQRGQGKPAGTPAPAAPAGAAEAPAGNAAPKPAPEKPAPAAAATPAAPASPKVPPATPVAATPPAAPKGPPGQPTPDCLAVGISTAAQCDAFHARRQHLQGAGAPSAQPPGAHQPREAVGKLPPGVKPDQLAPLLDSAKQREVSGGVTPPAAAAARVHQAPPPSNDEAAQAGFRIRKAPPLPPPGAQPANGRQPGRGIELPQNVTVVNQTMVNNTTVNNTTINNNNAPGQPGRHHRPGGFGEPGMMPPPGAIPPPPPGMSPRYEAREPNPIGLAIGAVLQLGDRLIVDSSGRDQYRISGGDRYRTQYVDLPDNRYMETIYRPDGVRIVTIYDRDGDVLRRSRFDADGHEIVLAYFDYNHDKDLGEWTDPGADLPPLQLDVNVNNYVLDAAQADESQIQRFLAQPPIEPVPRLYSLDEVERSARLRDIMPRIELADLTFDTGSATLAPDQVQDLSEVADAMLALLRQNPAETFLIEGHTDAVGSPASNLVLSDARAAEVAEILTSIYHVPPENLATQGYGAEFLRIQTAGPERLNRRVVIRRITPLVTIAQADD